MLGDIPLVGVGTGFGGVSASGFVQSARAFLSGLSGTFQDMSQLKGFQVPILWFLDLSCLIGDCLCFGALLVPSARALDTTWLYGLKYINWEPQRVQGIEVSSLEWDYSTSEKPTSDSAMLDVGPRSHA